MADRYWVGGSGTWNTTSTANWSTASGGSSGASVPTAADSVFFDQAGTYTVTMTGALTCLDITVSAGTVTFATGTTPTLAVSGSMSLLAGTVWSSTGTITFNATTSGKTVTTNGTVIAGSVTFNGTGGGWTLGSAFSVTGGGAGSGISILAGTFDTSSTGNYSVTSSNFFQSYGSVARTINLNNSTISITTVSATALSLSPITNLTFNAGTSQINLTGSTSGISSGGLTFYNVAFTSTTAGARTVTGANTFNNFAVTASSAAGTTTVTFDSKQTINGTLSTTGTAGNQRVFFASATYGISVDLAVNSAPSLTDADFRGIYVTGTASPVSGTRIGNRGECRGITFDTPKTVYWNLAGAQNWSANGWATTSTGSPSTDNFPLPQDTATFTNSGSVTGTITLDTAIAYVPNVDMSNRTSAMTLGTSNATTVYGNWTNGSGTAFTGTATLTFSGGATQTITSAGKTFSCPITVDTYGGTVQLGDALNIGTNTLTVTNGTFDTKGYNVTAGALSSSNSNVRTITLGASTVTLSNNTNQFIFNLKTNLIFNSGTSNIILNSNTTGTSTLSINGLIFNNFTYTNTSGGSFALTLTGENTFNNLTFSAPVIFLNIIFQNNQTINGTLTCAGASAVRRIFLSSSAIGTQRTLTANSISATDCDFRDINLAGAASGASPTRAGDCGGNSGIIFPAAKTVYWNLSGAQYWSATGWATSSGGTPAANNFPLAQDTAVFNNTGSVTGTITIDSNWNIGTFDASARTSAMTLTTSTSLPVVYGDWKFGTGVTSSSTTGTITFSKNGTQIITSNGVQFGCPVTINHPSGTVQLADAISFGSTKTLILTAGTFDAVTYNVTVGAFANSATTNILKMGSGTWTLAGTATVWFLSTAPTLIVGTSTIVLSDTSTTVRTFAGGGLYYNKLTIGGSTGTSTLTISGANTFGELASTKTVAHTITFPSSTTTTIGKWSVTGTSGNVVTLAPSTAATTYTLSIAGPANSGIDYLSVSYCTVDTASPGEFYVGANSTNTAGNTRVIFTAAPTPRTLYWVGGTGNWSATTSWSTSSGGGSGAAIPTSLDSVNFDSLSNATAYTATIDAGVTIARCASFTMAGPLIGNVTFAGTVGIAFHGNVSFAATGITRTYSGAMNWAGNSSYTFTTNGLTLASACTVTGVGATWALGSALNTSSIITTFGTFSTSASNYSITSGGQFSSNNSNVRAVNLNGSTLTLSTVSATAFNYGTTTNLSFDAGTSQINLAGNTSGISSTGLTFYNVSFTGVTGASITITGANTFNTLSFAGRTSVGVCLVTFNANQIITTLTLNAGTAASYRTFLASNAIGTQRTLTVTTLTAGAADYDFRDIAIAGGAFPIAPTRAGDCKGNSGITFPVAKTVYFAVAASSNWGATGAGAWSLSNNGTPDGTAFPLAQDTAIFPSTPTAYPTSGNIVTVNDSYNIGTVDMQNRTTNTMTLATGTTTPAIYGNWINGTGVTLTGTGTITFAGRVSQTITSAGVSFTQPFSISVFSGSLTLQDAHTSTASITHIYGTFDLNGYTCTRSSLNSSVGNRTISFGNATLVITGGSGFTMGATNGSIIGNGTIQLTSSSSKTFAGGGVSYSGITLDQGGAGALTISGNNTFKDITNTYSATGATSISFGATTQTLTQFTATGASGKVLTLSGTSAASPATLVLSSGTVSTPDYLTINNVRAYPLTTTWYAGANSTNGGSLGWYFVAAGGTVYAVTITETGTGTDSISAGFNYVGTISDTATGSDSISSTPRYLGLVVEVGTGSDSFSAIHTMRPVIAESATVTDADLARLVAKAILSETATGTDADSAIFTARSSVAETTTATDSVNAPGSTYNAPVLELITLQDAARVFATFQVTVTESATGSQTNSAAFIPYAQITESAAITDVASALAAFAARTAESASAADTVLVAPSVFNAVALAAAQAVDNFNPAGSVYNATAVEVATVLDSLIGGFLWNLINDAQGAGWSLVSTDPIYVTPYWSAAASSDSAVILVNIFGSYVLSTGGQALAHSLPGTGARTTAYYVNGYFYVFGTTGSANNGKLLRSSNGLDWSYVTLPVTNRPAITVFGNGAQLGVVQNGRVYISVDNGATWTGGDTGFLTFAYRTDCIWDGAKYVLTDGSQIRTSVNGLNWTTLSGPIFGYSRGCLVWDGATYMCLRTSPVPNNPPILRYSTNGTTWTGVSLPLGLLQATDLFLADGAFALITSGGVFYTTQAPAFTFAQQGTATNYTYPRELTPGYMVAKFKGRYYLPGIGNTQANGTFLTTTDLLTFESNAVTEWGTVDDNQTPNWQNTNTLN